MSGIKGKRAITGSSEQPRLSVKITNKHVVAQLIDDTSGHTLVYTTTMHRKAKQNETMYDKAAWVGSDIAKKAKKAKISSVCFDRGRKRYHGRVRALAEAAREEGLEF